MKEISFEVGYKLEMTSLNDIPSIASFLKKGNIKTVKLLNVILFNELFDRRTRKKLRNFSSFPKEVDLEERKKIVSDSFSLNDLICVLNVLGLDTNGNKEELINRTFHSLSNLSELKSANTPLSESESDKESDDEAEENKNSTIPPTAGSSASLLDHNSANPLSSPVANPDVFNPSFYFVLKDLGNSMRKFSASDSYCVKTFLQDCEESFSFFSSLSEQQKVIFAKTLVEGQAKSFIHSQRNLNTWLSFKSALLEEFSYRLNSAEIHRQLSMRKKLQNESFSEYFIAIRELASNSFETIDDLSLIDYCINGIQDYPSNKTILYGAKTILEFKEKLRIYEKIVNDRNKKPFQRANHRANPEFIIKSEMNTKHNVSKTDSQNENTGVRQKICFNCNMTGHVSRFCPNKHRGLKCNICKRFGHISANCTNKPIENKNDNTITAINHSPPLMYKTVTINDNSFNALVDTGSQKTILKKHIYDKIGSPALTNFNGTLTAFGNGHIKPIGNFTHELIIDNQTFIANFCVVNDEIMSSDAIIGMDILMQAELKINADGVTLTKISNTKIESDDQLSICNISLDDKFELEIGSNVTKTQRNILQDMISSYKPIKTETTDIQMSINLKNETPITHRPRRLPFPERKIVDDQVTKWLEDGVVEQCSSEFSSQVVVVKKKDGTPRVCIDYRQLNKNVIKDSYPLPLIDDLLDKLQDANMFSTIDLRNAFFHLEIEPKSRKYTSFVTHNGQYQFLRAPFGLCISPTVFQRYINTIFKDLIIKGHVLIYMDDVIIPSKNEKEGIERLKSVFSLASSYGLDINFQKCKFLSKQIEFLGHVIENGKLYPSPQKVKAVLNFPEPKSNKDLQSFLGLAGYFRKFIYNFSIIAHPLTELLKKNREFKFSDSEKQAFNCLKQSLSSPPVLSIYNQNADTEIHCDASINGYGCILLQKSITDNALHPVYFMSKKTSDAEKKYSSYELEVLAIVKALQKFRVYLLGKHFKIVTDCNAFAMTLNKKDLCTRIARWALLMQDFDYEVEHRSGSKMNHVDALSRYPVMIIQDSLVTKIKTAQEQDSEIQTIKEILKLKPYSDFLLKSDILYKFIDGEELLVVPESMQIDIIRNAHDRGHYASKRTEETLKHQFYIPKVKEKIDRFIKNCVPCILINRKTGKQDGLLHPIEKEAIPLHTYHVDHLGPLTSTNKNYKFIFAIIDSFTKFVWLYPTKSTDAAEVIAKLENQKHVFGNPSRIISDRGTAFTSKQFQDYCSAEKIEHFSVTTGLPRANGQIERLNSVITAVISKLSIDNPEKWYKHVNEVQKVINSTFQRSINTTPFELLFGIKMRSQQDLNITDLLNEEIQAEFVNNRDELRKQAKEQILQVQDENRRSYNLRRRLPAKYKLHDLVAIKRTQLGPGLKLKPKYLGPYKITKVKQNDTYDVQKCAFFEGPNKTSTCAEFLKPWTSDAIT